MTTLNLFVVCGSVIEHYFIYAKGKTFIIFIKSFIFTRATYHNIFICIN